MLMEQNWRYRLSDFDHAVFAALLPAEHPLRDMLVCIPWEEFTPILEGYYDPDRGQPAIKPLLILKLEFLRYVYRLSDREVVDRGGTDVLFRYFFQIPVSFQLPDASVLAKFRGRIGPEGFKAIFDRLVGCAREAGLVKDRLRLKDASHVIANIAVPTVLKLLGQIRDRLIDSLAKFDSEMSSGFRMATDQMREQTEGLDPEARLLSRVLLVRDILDGIKQLTPPAEAHTNVDWQKLQALRQVGEKILDDQAHPEKGHRTISVVDIDARRGKHGDWYDGFVLDVLMDADSEIITQIAVLEAGGDEAKSAVSLLNSEQQTHGNQVEELSIDGAGFNGAMLREIENPEGLNVKVFTPPKDSPVNADLFPSSAFKLSEDGQSVTCPGNQTSSYSQTASRGSGMMYRFTRSQCESCPLVAKCVSRPESGAIGRTVRKNEYEAEYDRARERAATEEYASISRKHPAIERKLNDVMNYCGGRFAKYWGHEKIRIQQYMCCMTSNIKQMTRLIVRGCAVNV